MYFNFWTTILIFQAIFFILLVLVLATLTVHMLIISNITFIPESLAIVILGKF